MTEEKPSSNNTDEQKPNRPDPMKPMAPRGGNKFNLILWLIILFVIPAVFLSQNTGGNAKELTESELFQKLRDKEVKKLELVTNPTSGEAVAEGFYQNDSKQDIRFRATILANDTLVDTFRDYGYKVVYRSDAFSAFLWNVLPIIILLAVLFIFLNRQMRSAGRGAMTFGKSRARLSVGGGKVTFKDVAGLDEGKEEVEEIVQYLKDPAKVQDLGGRVPKGVLMVGPPGTGKTLLARAIAGEADAPFYSISGSDFVEMFVGVGASRVRDMFEQAKKNPPCLIFIDEIDAVGRARFNGVGGGNDEREQTLNALLVEMDGFEANSGVVVIAATNRPDVLDKALLRPGRFDRQINIDLPDRKGREEILAVHARKIKLAEDVDLKVIARGTPGFSGADLANLLNESALIAARFDKKAVTMLELEEAKEKVCWGRERKNRNINEKERFTTAVHEAGHALVGLHLEHATPLHKVTIIPRGNAYLGATMYLPEDDRFNHTKSELVDQIAVSMGGRAAEEIVIGEITSGAAGDIQKATEIAKKMVCRFGMSDLGPLDYTSPANMSMYGGQDDTKGDRHSDAVSNKIDQTVYDFVHGGIETARRILNENREALDKFTAALLEKETMDVAEICDLLGIDKSKLDKERFALPDEVAEVVVSTESDEATEEKAGE